jgi:LysM repeat protein
MVVYVAAAICLLTMAALIMEKALMKRRQFATHAVRSGALFLILTAGGCVTMETREDQVQQEEQQRSTQQSIDRLKVQVESILAQQDQLQQQLQQLRASTQDRATTADLQNIQNQTQGRIAELDRKIAALDAARAQDKQEIVGTLTKNMSVAMAQMNHSSPPPTRSSGGGTKNNSTPPSRPTTGGAPQKAYEHVVAAGDTLSAIASAYHVSASAIIAANNLKDAAHLKVGQKLLIPAP